ncbi:MAG TPA: hypothetical protein VG894_02135 [Bauldia sp.]|nr:hypothetical protein [Bauldia sp.]
MAIAVIVIAVGGLFLVRYLHDLDPLRPQARPSSSAGASLYATPATSRLPAPSA